MKIKTILTIFIAVFLLTSIDAQSQVKINLKKKISEEANKRANKKADETVNKGFDELEKGIEGIVTGFGKASGGILKNHYPKGLRLLNIAP